MTNADRKSSLTQNRHPGTLQNLLLLIHQVAMRVMNGVSACILFSCSDTWWCRSRGRQQGLTSRPFPVLCETDPAHRSGHNSTVRYWLDWLQPGKMFLSAAMMASLQQESTCCLWLLQICFFAWVYPALEEKHLWYDGRGSMYTEFCCGWLWA